MLMKPFINIGPPRKTVYNIELEKKITERFCTKPGVYVDPEEDLRHYFLLKK